MTLSDSQIIGFAQEAWTANHLPGAFPGHAIEAMEALRDGDFNGVVGNVTSSGFWYAGIGAYLEALAAGGLFDNPPNGNLADFLADDYAIKTTVDGSITYIYDTRDGHVVHVDESDSYQSQFYPEIKQFADMVNNIAAVLPEAFENAASRIIQAAGDIVHYVNDAIEKFDTDFSGAVNELRDFLESWFDDVLDTAAAAKTAASIAAALLPSMTDEGGDGTSAGFIATIIGSIMGGGFAQGVVASAAKGIVAMSDIRIDPLVLDLDGNGADVTALIGGGKLSPLFDGDADGFGERTAWVRGADALLTLDKNGNGGYVRQKILVASQNL